MDFTLKVSNSDKFILPVNPEAFSFKETHENTSVNVNKLGEVNVLGYRKLKEGTISSFFPSQSYNFSKNGGRHDPKWYIDKILGWKAERKKVRVIIGKYINILCTIESFQYGEQDGTGDVYFILAVKEYRAVEVEKLTSAEKSKLTAPQKKKETPKKPQKKKKTPKRTTENKPKVRTHTVKYGDTLWGLAKKYYGNGALYTKIFNANRNRMSNPNVIYVGWVLTIP